MGLISFISERQSIKALNEELHIKIKDYDYIVCLNYSQIDSPKTHPVVIECRGVILDKESLSVICRPFDRFFNYGEAPETYEDFDIRRAVAYEKVDGSLIKIYNYGGEWFAGTKGTAFGEAPVGDSDMTFFDLVCNALEVDGQKEFNQLCEANLDSDITYLFEVTSPENRVVKRYEGQKLWYLGARVTKTGEDVSGNNPILEQVNNLGCSFPQVYTFDTIEHCIESSKNLTDLDEGYVLHDQKSNKRVKVKSPAYVAVHHLRGEGLSQKRIKQLVLTGEQDEYLKYFPEDEDYVTPIVDDLHNFEKSIDAVYQENKDIEDQKDFALAVKDYPFSGILFTARKFDSCPLEEFRSLDTNRQLKAFNSFLGVL